MEKINQKLVTFDHALETLQESVVYFRMCEKGFKSSGSTKEAGIVFRAARDSMIQRFEYCIDFMWKVLKVYLEDVEKVTLDSFSPRGVVREASAIKTITEKEGELFMKMVKNRNETYHIYHQEIAENIAHEIPAFYEAMRVIAHRIRMKIS